MKTRSPRSLPPEFVPASWLDYADAVRLLFFGSGNCYLPCPGWKKFFWIAGIAQ